jgi:hypothetical protein
VRADALSGYKEDRGSPGGEQVDTGNQFRGKGGQERPMPSEQTPQNGSHRDIKHKINRGSPTGHKEREKENLDGIRNNGHKPSQPVLRRIRDLEEVRHLGNFLELGYTLARGTMKPPA